MSKFCTSNNHDWWTATQQTLRYPKSHFVPFSSVSITELEHVFVCWEDEQYFVFSKSYFLSFLWSYMLRVFIYVTLICYITNKFWTLNLFKKSKFREQLVSLIITFSK